MNYDFSPSGFLFCRWQLTMSLKPITLLVQSSPGEKAFVKDRVDVDNLVIRARKAVAYTR